MTKPPFTVPVPREMCAELLGYVSVGDTRTLGPGFSYEEVEYLIKTETLSLTLPQVAMLFTFACEAAQSDLEAYPPDPGYVAEDAFVDAIGPNTSACERLRNIMQYLASKTASYQNPYSPAPPIDDSVLTPKQRERVREVLEAALSEM